MTDRPRTHPRTRRGNAKASGYERNLNDWYVEPPYVVEDFLDAWPVEGAIWDPSCGRGTIPIVCRRRGHEAIGSDLVDRGFGQGNIDFLSCRSLRAPTIISNPPFAIIHRWMAHALALGPRQVIIFARLGLLEGIERGKWFQRSPFRRVYVCSYRVPCPPGEIAPAIDQWERNTIRDMFLAFAWFIWQPGYSGETDLRFLLPPDATIGGAELDFAGATHG